MNDWGAQIDALILMDLADSHGHTWRARKRPVDLRINERTPIHYPANYGYDDSKI